LGVHRRAYASGEPTRDERRTSRTLNRPRSKPPTTPPAPSSFQNFHRGGQPTLENFASEPGPVNVRNFAVFGGSPERGAAVEVIEGWPTGAEGVEGPRAPCEAVEAGRRRAGAG
jgi:hypothetical protein